MDPRQLRQVWGAELSMIFQDPMTALNPVKRIGKQITESLRLHLGMDRGEAKAHAVELLRSVGIPSPEERIGWYPFQLSGGMRQRVMIAIALACAPRLVMADEPTTGLDVTVQAQILDLLADLQRERHMAVILVTHDLGVVASRADHIVVMYAGRIVERAPTRTLFADTHMPYTRALMDSIPRLSEPSGTRLRAIAGRPPDLISPPPGCRFAPRCPYVQDKCRESEPPLRTAGSPDHLFACWFPLVNGIPTAPSTREPGPAREAAPAPVPSVDRPRTGLGGRHRHRPRRRGAVPVTSLAPDPTVPVPGAAGDTVLEVDDLVVEFRSGHQRVHAVSGVSFTGPAGRDPRAGGRVRLRQVDHRSGPRPGPAGHLGPRRVPRPGPGQAVQAAAARRPHQDADDLPGPDLLAQPTAAGPGHRGRAARHLATRDPGRAGGQGARHARGGRDRPRHRPATAAPRSSPAASASASASPAP